METCGSSKSPSRRPVAEQPKAMEQDARNERIILTLVHIAFTGRELVCCEQGLAD